MILEQMAQKNIRIEKGESHLATLNDFSRDGLFRRLAKQLDSYCRIPVLEFDSRAAVEFQRLRKSHRGTGTMDLRIAAIVITNGATLLSRNLSDFQKIARLQVEDWTA